MNHFIYIMCIVSVFVGLSNIHTHQLKTVSKGAFMSGCMEARDKNYCELRATYFMKDVLGKTK